MYTITYLAYIFLDINLTLHTGNIEVTETKEISIVIPADIDTGTRLRVRRTCNAGKKGGQSICEDHRER